MMNFKQFLYEKALNSGVFAKTIERLSSSAKLGFELEMWVPEDSDLLIIKDEDSSIGDFEKTAEEAKKSLEDMITGEIEISTTNIDAWRIVKDGSIQDAGVGCGIEIVSPPLNIEDGLGDLKQMFKWMVKHDVVTNSSTGLHLNLSIPDLSEKLDALKLVLFMGESHILGKYDRKFNTYALEHTEEMINSIRDHGKIPKKLAGMQSVAEKALLSVKYRTVNLSKLNHGYLEFRTAGNDNYHKNFSKVEDDVGRFLTLLELACDPEAEKQEYIKKLAKLFRVGLDTEREVNKTDGLKNFVRKYVGSGAWAALSLDTPHAPYPELLHSMMAQIGKRVAENNIDVPLKIVAEFKIYLRKLEKISPDVLRKARAESRNQVAIDYVKAFMKAFNLK